MSTPSFNASLSSFSRGQLILSLRRYAPPPSEREALMHVARESTVVAGPVSDKLYMEVNACVITK